MNLLEVRDLSVQFRIDEVTTLAAVKGISFDVPVRSTVALVGESGSGKSVTALSVMGLLPPENATVGPASRTARRSSWPTTRGSRPSESSSARRASTSCPSSGTC